MAQNEMRAMRRMPVRVRLSEGLGVAGSGMWKLELHTFMAGDEAERLIKTNGVWAGLVRGELNQVALAFTRSFDGPHEETLADTGGPDFRSYSDSFDEGSPGTLMGQIGDVGDLEYADDRACLLCHDEFVVCVFNDRLERAHIAAREGNRIRFSLTSERIVSEQLNDAFQVGTDRSPECEFVHC